LLSGKCTTHPSRFHEVFLHKGDEGGLAGVHVLAARPNYPTSGKVRIYLSDVASTTVATPIAWFVLG
jgi:hypothetical protein